MKRIAIACIGLVAIACGREHSEAEYDEDEAAVSTGSCGVERWAVKTGADTDVGLVNLTAQDTTVAALRGISAPASLGQSSPRFTYSGSPELQAYRLTNVTLTQYKLEDDSDYHLVLSDASGNTLIGELADPACATSSAWKTQITSARAAFDAKYTPSTSFKTANVTVSLVGVGFFDLLHGQTGVAPNGIELHSILSICFGSNCSTGGGGGGGGTSLTNGGFESGLTGWTSTGSTAATTPAHTGTAAARVGSTAASTDSSISQTFTLPSTATQLSFWYRVTCPDTVTYDWATATLKDNTAGTTTTVLAKTCTNDGVWRQITATVTAGHSVTLTVSNHDDNVAGDPTYTMVDDVAIGTGSGGGGGGGVTNPVVNPGFETGTLSGWTASGPAAAKTYPHTGTYGVALGSTSPSTDSSVAQTFTIPAGASTITFWYKNGCPDTVTYDWTTVTLRDNTAGTTTTLLPHTCVNDNVWHQVSGSVSAMGGHSVTLTLANHDDNYAGDATWTDFDDISVQ